MISIDRLVTPWADRDPERVAIDDPNGLTTYRDLDELANRFANAFRAAGVKPGDRVGVHLPRSARAVAAMLGASRVRAAYVPLDPASPASRMGLIAQDCGLSHVVISPPLLAGWISAGVCQLIQHAFLTEDAVPPDAPASTRVHTWSALQAEDPSPGLAPEVSPDDLAYLLYTSGSTGVPKGVMLSHRNALAFVEWAADEIGLSAADRVASVAPFHFDLSVFDVWASLMCGATIVVVDEATVVSGRRMLDRIHAKAITVWYSVPSALVLMLESGGLAERSAPSLRAVFFAGEVFPVKYLRSAMLALPNARFLNLFGPTETNVCLAYEVPSPPALNEAAIPIGHATCGDTFSILDPQGRAVADGEVGELFVDGPTVMLGYWDGGRRTPARHPYATGDMVSRRPDGELLYHGRRDHMVKIHGFRVELGEVEAALHACRGIQEAIVFAFDQELVAVAVPCDPSLSVLDVKRHCATRLPRYMIPTEVRLVERLPRTSSGKADRVRTKTAFANADVSLLTPVERAEPRKDASWTHR